MENVQPKPHRPSNHVLHDGVDSARQMQEHMRVIAKNVDYVSRDLHTVPRSTEFRVFEISKPTQSPEEIRENFEKIRGGEVVFCQYRPSKFVHKIIRTGQGIKSLAVNLSGKNVHVCIVVGKEEPDKIIVAEAIASGLKETVYCLSNPKDFADDESWLFYQDLDDEFREALMDNALQVVDRIPKALESDRKLTIEEMAQYMAELNQYRKKTGLYAYRHCLSSIFVSASYGKKAEKRVANAAANLYLRRGIRDKRGERKPMICSEFGALCFQATKLLQSLTSEDKEVIEGLIKGYKGYKLAQRKKVAIYLREIVLSRIKTDVGEFCASRISDPRYTTPGGFESKLQRIFRQL